MKIRLKGAATDPHAVVEEVEPYDNLVYPWKQEHRGKLILFTREAWELVPEERWERALLQRAGDGSYLLVGPLHRETRIDAPPGFRWVWMSNEKWNAVALDRKVPS